MVFPGEGRNISDLWQLIDSTASAKLLLQNKADVNYRDPDSGQEALHFAAQSGYLDVMGFLVQRGSSVDSQDDYGKTPLILASEAGHTKAVKYLLLDGKGEVLISLRWERL